MATHYDTFRDQLAIAYPNFGYALWVPDAGQLFPAVEVGDVGFIRKGKFHRLFNALLPALHPSHIRGTPENYESLHPFMQDRHIDYGILRPKDFCSSGVRIVSGGLEKLIPG